MTSESSGHSPSTPFGAASDSDQGRGSRTIVLLIASILLALLVGYLVTVDHDVTAILIGVFIFLLLLVYLKILNERRAVTRFSDRRCAACGAANLYGSRFCRTCGIPLPAELT